MARGAFELGSSSKVRVFVSFIKSSIKFEVGKKFKKFILGNIEPSVKKNNGFFAKFSLIFLVNF